MRTILLAIVGSALLIPHHAEAHGRGGRTRDTILGVVAGAALGSVVTSQIRSREYPGYRGGYGGSAYPVQPYSYPSSGTYQSYDQPYRTSVPAPAYPSSQDYATGYPSGYGYPVGGYPQTAYRRPADGRLMAIRAGLAQACRAGDTESCTRLRTMSGQPQVAECPRSYGY